MSSQATDKDSLLSDAESEETASKVQAPIIEDTGQTELQYTDEELEELIGFIKNMTTLYDLQSTDWTPRNDEIIKQFIMNPNELLLIIYFDQDFLTCSLEIPKLSCIDLTYFLRQSPGQIFNVETFHDCITFGTIDNTIDGSILNLIENLYSPIFFNSHHWPESVHSNFSHDLHVFLQKFNDIYYKLMGLTVLYIPKESFDLTISEIVCDKEMIRRIETIVVYWIGQIRFALEEQEQTVTNDLNSLNDEYEFWVHRHENLSCLKHQLSNKTVKHICNILSALQSTYFNQIMDLSEQIEQKLDEARSNIEYLSLLCKSNDELRTINDISLLHEKIEEILHLIRFIWLNSPFYNTNEKITTLCRLLSNQLITQCTNTIDLPVILEDKHSRYGIASFEKCIRCLTDYIRLYTLIADTHTQFDPNKPWILERESIFNHIDSFIQRCNDMIEICEAMIHFGRYDEIEIIKKPQFTSSRYQEFDNWVNKIEEIFNESLNRITDNSHVILDINKSQWLDFILIFKARMKDIESIIENLANNVFEECANVEEGLENLSEFYNYSRRKSLQPSFEQKTLYVFNLFKKEIVECERDLNEDFYPARLGYFSGRAIIAKAKQNRLRNIKQMFDEAHWLLPCNISEDVFSQYQRLITIIDDRIMLLYREWINTLDLNIADNVQQSLIRKSVKRPGLFECNIDRTLLQALCEANYWESINYDIPLCLKDVYKRYNSIKLAYNSVVNVVIDYNKIITSLSDEERLLFKPLIVIVEKKLRPALSALNWSSDVNAEYISECVCFISDLQKFLNDYKIINTKIVKICEDICDTIMIPLKSKFMYNLNALEREILEHIARTIDKFIEYYQRIIQYLILIFEGFENHMITVADQWIKYINNFDTLMEESLKICCQKSLLKIYKILRDDNTTSPNPLIHVKCYLKDIQIDFNPPLSEVTTVFNKILYNIINGLQQLPRLNDKFHVAKATFDPYCEIVAKDEECKKYQQLLDDEINFNIKKIHEFIKMWEPFRDVWQIDKDQFLHNYEIEQPTAQQFDSDIIRYDEIINNVDIQETLPIVHFIQINCDELKRTIIKHCYEWQQRLRQLLLTLTKKKIDDAYNYIKTNSELLSDLFYINFIVIIFKLFRIKHKPEDLKQMQIAIIFYDKCVEEVPQIEQEFPLITEQIKILNKYEIELSLEYTKLEQCLPGMWEEYLELLEQAEKMLAYARVIVTSLDEDEP